MNYIYIERLTYKAFGEVIMKIRKNRIQTIIIAVAIIFVFLVSIVLIRYIGESKMVLLPISEKTSQTIILDPGHGGMDGGAVGVNQLVEKNINLQIAIKLEEMLSLNGFNVIMTRDTDVSIHDSEITNLNRQKRSDMYNRLKIIEDHPEAIFISIHQNKFPQAQAKGAQMFYSTNLEDSKKLAGILQQNFISYLQPENTREIKPSGEELFLLHNAHIPAVLVECGFLSNEEDAANLQSSDYQDKIVFTIFNSLIQFCSDGELIEVPLEDAVDLEEEISLQEAIWPDLK